MKRIFIALLLIGIDLSVNPIFAKATCDDTVAYLAKIAKTNGKMPSNINQIESSLGKKTPTTIHQKQYSWKDFTIFVRDDQIIKVYGKIPYIFQDAITTPTLQEAVLTLGKPVEGPQTTLNQYAWICDIYGSILTVYTTLNGSIVSYDGLLCRNNIQNCVDFDTMKFGEKNFQVN